MSRSAALSTAIVVLAALIGVGTGAGVALLSSDDSPADDSSQRRRTPSTSPTTNSASAATPSTGASPSHLLYFADRVIYDGDRKVEYEPTRGSRVGNLARTSEGWVVFERFGQDGSRLVLVARDGDTSVLPVTDPHSFDVSPDTTAVAAPVGSDSVGFFDTATGGRLRTLTTPGVMVRSVRYGGEDLFVDGTTPEGRSVWQRYDPEADALSPLEVRLPNDEADISDVSVDGRYLLSGYPQGESACTAAYDLLGASKPQWSSCAFTDLGGSSFSPDAERLVVSAKNSSGAMNAHLAVVDRRSGSVLANVPVTGAIDGSWASDDELVVEAATSAALERFTLHRCPADGGACSDLLGASTGAPASNASPGRNR